MSRDIVSFGFVKAIAKNPALIPEVKSVIAVASGKGGVGRSTVAANQAFALAKLGRRVGLLDVDIYGPSVPTMFGVSERPLVVENRIEPFERWGVELMSIGFVLDTDTPVIWRGPTMMKAIEQLIGDVDWAELDFMILDMPPGTGDAGTPIVVKRPDGAHAAAFRRLAEAVSAAVAGRATR